jgi:hypothetical protein
MTVREWKDRVAALGCMVCGQPATLHHPRMGQGKGQRASDWLVVPLCREHHQGAYGIESPRSFYLHYKLDEVDLLARTIEGVARCL